MAHITALAQHISTLEPDKDAARLSFYQYLKNLCDATEQVTPDLINRFYARALGFTHWQENKLALFNEVDGLLHHFQESSGQPLPLNGVLSSNELQPIVVENMRNLELIVQRYLDKTVGPYDKVKLVREGDRRVIAIILQGDRSVRVTAFPKSLALREGELTPLHSEQTLYYTGDLQLHPMMIQQIEVGPHASGRFHTGVEGLRGSFVRGYTFQKFASLDGGGLGRYPLLFYPLKRLEQFFVDRKTDPMYIELTNNLEKALELLSHNDVDGERFANTALERGRLALEHIFPDDKLARLLITNLEKSLALASRLDPRQRAPAPAQADQPAPSQRLYAEPEGVDLLESESWPEIRNLPV